MRQLPISCASSYGRRHVCSELLAGVWKPVAAILRRGEDLSAYSQAQLDQALKFERRNQEFGFFRWPRNATVDWLDKG